MDVPALSRIRHSENVGPLSKAVQGGKGNPDASRPHEGQTLDSRERTRCYANDLKLLAGNVDRLPDGAWESAESDPKETFTNYGYRRQLDSIVT